MNTRKTCGLPAGLEAVRRRFEDWRKTHPPRSRIPDRLWAAAVTMAGRHGIHPTARALRLDYYTLKERLEQRAVSGPAPATGITAAPFVELPSPVGSGFAPGPLGPCECTVEWEDGAGAKMRLRFQGVATPDLAALGRSFWNRGL